jgi:hypothetical protein
MNMCSGFFRRYQFECCGVLMKSFVSMMAVLAAAAMNAQAALRVDISPDNGRKDELTKEAVNWVVRNGASARFESGGVTYTLRPMGGKGTVEAELYKGGLDNGATLATDGATVAGGIGLELAIAGLPAGRHTIATFHNDLGAKAGGRLRVEVRGGEKAEVQPSHRVANDEDAASAFVTFAAEAGQSVVIGVESVAGTGTDVILNGFELDMPNPLLRAKKPTPEHNDEHAQGDVVLTWTAPKSAISHDLYFGTDAAAVADATHDSREFKGTLKEASYAPGELDPWLTYYWRVDEYSDGNVPVKGPVWRFRARQLAFPGAEGYGRFARGGRGGKVYEVTNLNDSGPGSLREAVEAQGPRMIVFRVGGTIELKSKLVVSNPYCTIAGQTAPGDGILLKGFTTAAYGTHDVIMRYLRIRVSDESGQTLDGSGLGGCDNCIVDHCSISWSIDEAFSSRSAKNITLQRSIITEPLNMSVHSHYVGTGKGHSFAGSISGDIGSFHHNLVANAAGRNWSLAGGLMQGGEFAGRLDIRNNVVYNWVHRTTDGGVKELDYVGNMYIPGPATNFLYLLDPDAGIHPNTPDDFQRYYMAGNVMEGHPEFDADNWKGALLRSEKDGGPGERRLGEIKITAPMFESYVTTQSAREAYTSVMADVGANIPHCDSVDLRAINSVKNRTTYTVGSKTGLKGIIDSQKDAGGFPEMKGGTPAVDSDHDGIPDEWEKAHGLNPDDPSDGAKKAVDGSGYSNLEEYLNSLRPDGTSK